MSRDNRPLATQLETAFDELQYPIEDEADFAATFPSWSSTSFKTDQLEVQSTELYPLLPEDGYPYRSADEIVAALLPALRERDS